ncbi:hypothetical protein FHY55_02130 [Oceanicola sp. D3]|uniref:hypothetical protein n=1 Tax=Oceanicola sp. D3 TaxID=2587163 RepID=UPI001122C465|nr:hypothetical protein [Oceanicola sp. D3]QDC08110.1 hypothetical protein FHY55_02130 [Oceanicola sp. D3]
MDDLRGMPLAELMALLAGIGDELGRRGVSRSANSPTGDLAEYLFSRAMGWQLTANSRAGYDAVDGAFRRVQIKGLRRHRARSDRQLGALRDLDARPFDDLAAVIFGHAWQVERAVILPWEVVAARAREVAHTRSYRFLLTDEAMAAEGVRDVTVRVAAAML